MEQRVVIVGAGGQLGRELVRSAGPEVACLPLSRAELDIGDRVAVFERLQELAPKVVINAAAYTAVDRAESEPEQARRVNAEGPGNLAAACAETGARLLHVSTDFVFDGESARPYPPDAPTAPLGEYGRSKRDGELAVQAALPGAFILRTAWVYSATGTNFVRTMLRLMAERGEVAVVDDQIGTPTWTRGLTQALWAAAARQHLQGIYHWTDAGVCSWYDFAVAIAEEGAAAGLLESAARVRPIPASDFPTPARRPACAVLDKRQSWDELELEGVHWRRQLRTMLAELRQNRGH